MRAQRETPRDLRQLVHDARERTGLSHDAIAVAADLSSGYLSKLMAGTRGRRLAPAIMAKLARALDVTVDEVRRAHAATHGLDAGDEDVTDEELEVAPLPVRHTYQALRELSPHELELVDQFIAVLRRGGGPTARP